MSVPSELVLAVAGSRKTQGIVDACVAASPRQRILVLTFTLNNQAELRRRVNEAKPTADIEVSGWFTFLISQFIRPYLPFMFPGQDVNGLDDKSLYQERVPLKAQRRYFTQSGLLRGVHAAHLATLLIEASRSLPLRRLEAIYDHIYIDEVQDLGGYDLEIVNTLLRSAVPLTMVGDVRQAVITTSPSERKHKQYKNMQVWNWFRSQEAAGRLVITYRSETWRCRPEIAAFADSLFDSVWAFPKTVSLNATATDHDGVFLVRTEDVEAYIEGFAPENLRWGANSWKSHDHLTFMNFGSSKGLTRKRVLIFPTDKMKELIQRGKPLGDLAAAKLYVGVTRAEQSVAFVLDKAGDSHHPCWRRAN
ncbi:UvrD-helicase domain-containing protein [Arthrobacter zhaoguopingii]|uniref:UvrD-helicase domain-containing protein n=1 Tax=Arthrobacter zhaoguopingii TaxID=2681491 RepID=UPI001AEE1378|nr:UvrD-helicase domain-containing protein [Arthrobacter zhaoguopingii]